MNKILLRLLACPICKERVVVKENSLLQCVACNARYTTRGGIPVMVNLKNLPSHLKGQITYFQKSTRMYDTPKAREPWQDKYIERLSSHVRVYKNKVFVDNACGSGYMALMAAQKGAYVLACDLNMPGLIKLLRQAERLGLSDRFFAVCCTSEALPLRSHTVDTIVSNAILEHLPREPEAISEITRVTRKNGIAMVTVPLSYYLLNPIFFLVNYLYDLQIGHLRRYTKEMLVERFGMWQLLGVYYMGHTKKVLKTFFNIVWKIFDEKHMEQEDQQYVKSKLFASNISVLFKKK